MKERIVIDDKEVSVICEDCIMNENCKDKDTYKQARCCFNFQRIPANIKIEKQPETFEELKELCKKIDISKSADKIEIKLNCNDCLCVYKNGHICCMDENSNISLCYDRTPAQMWQIIKNLIGEGK